MFSCYLPSPAPSSCVSSPRVLDRWPGLDAAVPTLTNERSRVDVGNPFIAARFAANLALLSAPISGVYGSGSPSLHVNCKGVPSVAGKICL
jgi:hypothetical protein